MERYGPLSILVVIALAPAARLAAQDCRPDAARVQEIRAVASGIVTADNRRDIASVLRFYAADAVLMPPGEAPVIGRDRIRPRYEALFNGFTPEIEGRIDEACVEGGVGFVRGRNGGRMVARGSPEVRMLDDVYVMLLRRDANGAWLISHLIWHREGQSVPH
jgi:uncharacterized protein (TIGR02246 family)